MPFVDTEDDVTFPRETLSELTADVATTFSTVSVVVDVVDAVEVEVTVTGPAGLRGASSTKTSDPARIAVATANEAVAFEIADLARFTDFRKKSSCCSINTLCPKLSCVFAACSLPPKLSS
jgi:hypothetical protein